MKSCIGNSTRYPTNYKAHRGLEGPLKENIVLEILIPTVSNYYKPNKMDTTYVLTHIQIDVTGGVDTIKFLCRCCIQKNAKKETYAIFPLFITIKKNTKQLSEILEML